MAGMVVKNNMSAVNTLNVLSRNAGELTKSLRKVSSGMRINSAGDDASGYAIGERMAVQMRSFDQDNRNTQNGNSMLKVAEGAVANTVEIISTLKEKVLNAANDTNTDSDRAQIQKELDQMIDQIDDNANVTYNGMYMVDGSKNNVPNETSTHLTNRSFATELSDGSPVALTTSLTNLEDSTGRNLGIQVGDTITLSWVKKGITNIVSYEVKGSPRPTRLGYLFSGTNGKAITEDAITKLKEDFGTPQISNVIGKDSFGNDIYTPDYEKAITYPAKKTGVENQISGLTICVTDRDGNINKSANTILDNFEETIRAENGSEDNSIVLQTGTKANQAIKVPMSDMRAVSLGLKATDGTTLNISTQKFANAAINVLDMALQKCLNQQTRIGAVESRLDYTSANLTTASENTQSSMSTIQDADMAAEMTAYTKNNVLLQAAQSMLAQANQNSSSVLSLLQ